MAKTNYSDKKQVDMNLIPQSIDAEEAILGAVLVNPDVMTKVADFLSPECFYKPAHRYIYDAMQQLFNEGERIDLVSVSDVLNMNSKLELVGGRAYINDLRLNTITTSNVAYYAKIVQEKAIKRSLISAGSEIVTLGYDLEPVDDSLNTAEKLIFELSSKKITKDMTHIKDLVLETYENIEYRYNHRDELTGCPTGYYDLDAVTNGLQKSDLIILAARPSMGKTAFALNIAQNAAIRHKVPVAIFSLEMSEQQLVQRMMCSEAEVDANKIKTGNMQRKDWDKLANALNDLTEAPIYIYDSAAGSCRLSDIRANCRRLAMEEKNLGLIVIDYLQLMEGSGKEDRMQQISSISRGLKTIARELNIPIIALSQLSRAVESRSDKRPMLSDLRESGAIEQDADIVMFIYREEYYRREENEENIDAKPTGKEGLSEIILAKHRNGEVGTIELIFQGNITKFKNKIKTDIF